MEYQFLLPVADKIKERKRICNTCPEPGRGSVPERIVIGDANLNEPAVCFRERDTEKVLPARMYFMTKDIGKTPDLRMKNPGMFA